MTAPPQVIMTSAAVGQCRELEATNTSTKAGLPESHFGEQRQMGLIFEWDSAKALSNFEKHGVTFDEASTAFEDPLSMTVTDPLHSEGEERFVLIGCSRRHRLLVVVHTDRGDRVRIISARPAARKERLQHEEDAE